LLVPGRWTSGIIPSLRIGSFTVAARGDADEVAQAHVARRVLPHVGARVPQLEVPGGFGQLGVLAAPALLGTPVANGDVLDVA
jgi:hypothetical protein